MQIENTVRSIRRCGTGLLCGLLWCAEASAYDACVRIQSADSRELDVASIELRIAYAPATGEVERDPEDPFGIECRSARDGLSLLTVDECAVAANNCAERRSLVLMLTGQLKLDEPTISVVRCRLDARLDDLSSSVVGLTLMPNTPREPTAVTADIIPSDCPRNERTHP